MGEASKLGTRSYVNKTDTRSCWVSIGCIIVISDRQAAVFRH